MRMDDFARVAVRMLADWRRRPKQLRNTLSAEYTTSILRLMRFNACKHEAPDSIECAKWSQTKPRCDYPDYSLLSSDEKGPHSLTGEFVCGGCKANVVTSVDFIDALGLADKRPSFTDRTLRRYLNDGDPIPVHEFRRAVANGYMRGWLDVWAAIAIWQHIDSHNITRNTMLAVVQRASERKAFRLHKVVDVSQDEVKRELAKQRRMFDNEEMRAIDKCIKTGTLPPEMQQFMEEELRTRRQEAVKPKQVDDDYWPSI